ncbi:MAG: dUTP diphosphatase [Spirochaetales bacterium]|nr:dUTP diphosphatase [Spirochaetales bacterium]
MNEIIITYKTDNGVAPLYKTLNASGADLFAKISKEVVISPGERYLIPTGLYIEIPEGYEAQIRPRSGLAAKYGITLLNAPGTIDSDYRGEVKVLLINLGDKVFTIRNKDRIAQIVFAPVTRGIFRLVSRISETDRGKGGFGSTGYRGE